jgi:hypothetical protein
MLIFLGQRETLLLEEAPRATALLSIYARNTLNSGPIGLGLLRSAPAVGACFIPISI